MKMVTVILKYIASFRGSYCSRVSLVSTNKIKSLNFEFFHAFLTFTAKVLLR